MPTINTKEVTFHTRFPARDNWDLPQQLQALAATAQDGQMDLQAALPLLTRVIASWEFDGDPADVAVYDDLDIFREIIPLVTEVAQYVAGLTGLGEAASGRPSPEGVGVRWAGTTGGCGCARASAGP